MERNLGSSRFGTNGESWCTGLSAKTGPIASKPGCRRGEWISFGVALGAQFPVIYDSLGLVGAIGRRLMKWSPEHIREFFRLRTPDLLVLQFGGNESAYSNMTETKYEKDFRALLEKMREVAPESSCLVFSPLDQGERKRGKDSNGSDSEGDRIHSEAGGSGVWVCILEHI